MLKNLAIRTVTSSSWKASDERLAASLARFADVEADSAWQMLRALEASPDRELRAKLFENALEEMHHAEMFRTLAHQYAPYPPSTRDRRQEVFTEERGLPWFAAYHFVSENDVSEHFSAYADAAPRESDLRRTFLAIRGDEEEHRAVARAELSRLAGSEARAAALIRRVKAQRLYEAWKRLGARTANLLSSLLLNVVYVLTVPLLTWGARRHLRR
jgi:rubrerythrin